MVMEERTANTAGWGMSLSAAVCEACNRRFLLTPGNKESRCPNCFSDTLLILADNQVEVQPELYLPFKVSDDESNQSLQNFVKNLWFPPTDLTIENLRQRLRRVYLPVWLVDTRVTALWQAEAGFDYRVVSHQDRYDDARGGWSEQEVTETRVRWEARVGRLTKNYHNIAVPAIEKHSLLMNQLGEYSIEQSQAYDHQKVLELSPNESTFFRLFDRPQTDAWPDALPQIRNLAVEECRQACGADHIRSFTWTAEFQNQNWTLLLMPSLTTYYLDDQKIPRAVAIHGQTGRLIGTRRASMLRARNAALWIAAIACAIFVISLFVALGSPVLPALLVTAIIGWVLSVLFGVAAIVPLLMVWWTNRRPNPFDG